MLLCSYLSHQSLLKMCQAMHANPLHAMHRQRHPSRLSPLQRVPNPPSLPLSPLRLQALSPHPPTNTHLLPTCVCMGSLIPPSVLPLCPSRPFPSAPALSGLGASDFMGRPRTPGPVPKASRGEMSQLQMAPSKLYSRGLGASHSRVK